VVLPIIIPFQFCQAGSCRLHYLFLPHNAKREATEHSPKTGIRG
jgi:hypothetical protein